MSVYYISACHDCKMKLNWGSIYEDEAEIYHNKYKEEKHFDCSIELGSDYDDSFYVTISNYKSDTE